MLLVGSCLSWIHRARGLRFRKESDEPVAGFFSHIGDGHHVHHFWGKTENLGKAVYLGVFFFFQAFVDFKQFI